MATLRKHGREIGRIRYLTRTIAHMSDGTLLENDGDGWRIWGRVKPGRDPETVYADSVAALARHDARKPAAAAYRRRLHELAGMGKAWKLHHAIRYMPGDPDGVWSEACDGYGDNVHADVGEIIELMRLYEARIAEARNAKRID